MIFKTNVTKEDFKRAYTSCLKEAWIFHNLENFKKAIAWQNDRFFTYNFKQEITDEDDFNSNASTIDIFKTFEEIYRRNNVEELAKWTALWDNADGFDLVEYAGDAILDGNAVGQFARDYFTQHLNELNEGRSTKWTAKSFDHYSFKDALKKTQETLLTDRSAKYLYEAAFGYDDLKLKTRCDILEIVDAKHVKLYEVKATSKVKTEHFFDVVYQTYVLEKNGFIVDEIYLLTLNGDYLYGWPYDASLKETAKSVYERYENITLNEVLKDIAENDLLAPFENLPQTDLDYNRMFNFNDEFKKQVTFRDAYNYLDRDFGIKNLLTRLADVFVLPELEAKHLLAQDDCLTPLQPVFNKTEHKFIYKTYKKKLWCQHVVPWYDQSRETIFNLTGSSSFSNRTKASIYWQTGKVYLDEIPSLESLKLTNAKGQDLFRPEHYRIFESFKTLQHQKFLKPADILDRFHLPELHRTLEQFYTEKVIYMYDFETAKWALPRFWLSNTYQQIPFQYSIDVIHDQDYDYNNPTSMYHHDFLSSTLTDPRPQFIVQFIQDMLLTHEKGVYVAYNKSFEKTVLKYLATEFPKYAKPLIYIAAHTVDLMDFFKGKGAPENRPWFLVYHPNFHGSYSIKKTQPALDHQFNYEDLVINKGDKASQTFRQYVDGGISVQAWKDYIKPTMIAYCNRDTLAMVVILKQVENWLEKYEQEKKIYERL